MIREIATYEGGRRVRGSVYLGIGLALFALLFGLFFPSIEASGADLQQYIDSLPPAIRAAFGVEAITTIEGFLATEFYQFAWLLLLGVYFAYRAARVIAVDVETGRMDLLLAAPVSRRSVVVGKFLAILVPVVVLNLVAVVGVYGAVLVAGETISLQRLAVVHLLSVPYLLSTAAIGLLLSVAFARSDLAQRIALAAIFAGFLLDTITSTLPDLRWVGLLSPTRYYDPTAVLVRAEYDWLGGAVLLAATVALVGVATAWFRRRDVL